VISREIPDKPYFRIGEVADIVGVKASVLRYWETEFRSVRPEKTKTNQRVYSRKHVERLVEIRRLLYDQGFTIAGARKRLREGGAVENEGEAEAGEGAGEALPSAAAAGRTQRAVQKAIDETKDLLRLCDESAN
jgi:DNA-binding transcriptional MerR regulator